MIKAEFKEIRQLERDMTIFAKRGLPYATGSTLNRTAADARIEAQKNVKHQMTLRNRWTVGSIQYQKVRGLDISKQESATGSLQKYMLTQEDGGIERKSGKHGVAIPTGYSAGQEGQQPRTRLPRRPNKLSNIQLTRLKAKTRSRKSINFVKVKLAAESGIKFVFMDLGRRKGIFRILGGKRKPRVKMVADLSNPVVRIPRNPWLEPAAEKSRKRMPRFYKEALKEQLRRHRLFR